MPVSYSQLQTYRRCPAQYDFAFVKKIGRPMSAGESFGASIHNTLKRFGEREMEMKRGHDNPLTLFTDDTTHDVESDLSPTTLKTMWRACFIAEGYADRAMMDAKFREGERVLDRYYEWWASKPRSVVCIEKGFKCTVGERNILVSGRFDRVERGDDGLVVIDFKSSSPRSQSDVDEDLQLSVYAMAARNMWNEPVTSLTLLFLNESGVTELTTMRSTRQLEQAARDISVLAERMGSKDFAATPSLEKCRHCPYRNICPTSAA